MAQKQPNGPCPFGARRQHEWMTRADNGVVECNFCQAAANIGLFADTPDLLAALEAYQCAECHGRGMVNTPCPDPQCGDSTWDHECGLGSRPCLKCGGVSAAVQARAAIAKARRG